MHPSCHARVCVCVCVCILVCVCAYIPSRPHRCSNIQMSAYMHLYFVQMCHPHTHKHTSLSPACSPLTLVFSRYLTPIKYDRITHESFHQPVFSCSCFCSRGIFSPFSNSVSLFLSFHTSAMPSGFFLSFFPFYEVVLQSLGLCVLAQPRIVKRAMFGRRQVGQVCVNVCVHST